MQKYLLLLPVSTLIPLLLPIGAVTAQSSNCLNYMVNPKTGQEECINFSSSGVKISPNPVPTDAIDPSTYRAGYTLITVSKNGYQIYSGNKAFKRYKDTGYGFTGARIIVWTFYKKPNNGASRKSDFYHVDCNSLVMTLESTFDFDTSGNIVKGTSFGMTTATRYQSKAPYPKIVVQPGTVGYEIHNFACSAKVKK
ncbi:hypothetical protein [Aphanizomenon flos-aquae]|jgi:hypothetical protein|uniref:Uncharacterized protein n=1 Tax=Aphanizomenon flos-aquae FACHB-1040 TaxID=2692887 RepID=A0ABR8C119_APHFL|nr:hypothetical protein [Aphanizomenon flos-aquae]MBD2280060.1 hypothetical protein [Aphanizomenon flos-aquae FACHB-1040]